MDKTILSRLLGFSMLLMMSVSLFPPRIRPSMGCGPFRFFPNMWEIVPTSFYNLSATTQDFLFFIGSQAFSIPLCVLFWWVNLCFLIHSTVFKPKYRMQPTFYLHIMAILTIFMAYNHGSFLPGSVLMCYFVALASVYGNSVSLLRAQLKLVSCWHLPAWCIVKQILTRFHLISEQHVFILAHRKAVTSSSWSSSLRRWDDIFKYQMTLQKTDHNIRTIFKKLYNTKTTWWGLCSVI